MIALNRRRVMGGGGGSEPTAKSYIQDGLAAMYDGIENAGWGIHDANATSWVDLKGAYDFDWTGITGSEGVSWGEDYLYLLNGNKSNINLSTLDFPSSTNRTVEIVVKYEWKFTDNWANVQSPIAVYPSALPIGRGGTGGLQEGVTVSYQIGNIAYTAGVNNGSNLSNVFASYSSKLSEQIAGSTGANKNGVFYRNGNQIKVRTNYQSNWTPQYNISLRRPPRANVWVKCVRIYNRDLTLEEIQHNYQIDAIRFNL